MTEGLCKNSCLFVFTNGCVEKGFDNSTLLEADVYAEAFFCSSRDASFTDGLQFPEYLQSKGIIGIAKVAPCGMIEVFELNWIWTNATVFCLLIITALINYS